MKILPIIAAAAITLGAAHPAEACSRVVFLSDSAAKENIVMVGRTLDWRTPIPTNIYVYPAGITKQSMPQGPMLRWTSKYGSVVSVGYDGGITEGMNNQRPDYEQSFLQDCHIPRGQSRRRCAGSKSVDDCFLFPG